MKKKLLKTGISLVMALVFLNMYSISVMASAELQGTQLQRVFTYEEYAYSENMDEINKASCWNCGNYASYNTTEYGAWQLYSKVECVHGRFYDIQEIRDIFSVQKCSYCHYILQQTYLKTETKGPYCQ